MCKSTIEKLIKERDLIGSAPERFDYRRILGKALLSRESKSTPMGAVLSVFVERNTIARTQCDSPRKHLRSAAVPPPREGVRFAIRRVAHRSPDPFIRVPS